MPRIAYFILAHAQADQLARLVAQLNTPDTHFYIHIDANTPPDVFAAIESAIQATQAQSTFIDRQPCRWGGFSLVEASLRLIKIALRDGFDWGVLLSGQDYPIHSNEYISHYLANSSHAGFIDIKPPSEFDVAYRYRAWHFETLNGKKSGKALQKIQRLANACGLQRELPHPISQIYAGSQWWMLNQQACQAICDFTEKNPKVT
ncbi:MAG: beta-1,6-N-acetylglucosaminyltransferase, partial [Deefgea sp.]